jgi:branched-chain amino acid transport system permease protein
MMDQQFLSIPVNGILIGVTYFLAASGLTILFGILRVLNFAHGSFIMVGAYVASTFLRQVGTGYGPGTFFLISLAVGAVVGVLGLIVDRIVFRRLHGVDEAVALIATFALMLVVNGGATLIWGANYLSVEPPHGLDGAVSLGPVMVPAFSLYVLGIGVVVFVLLEVFFHRSWAGKTLRGIAEDRWIMGILGHSPRRLELLAVFLAFFLAGFAGSVLVPNQILSPNLGNHLIIQVFAVVIVGGLGSMRGTFLAAMLLGVAESIGSVVMPSLSLYVCMIIILVLRPQGLIAPRLSVAPGSWSFSWVWHGLSASKRPLKVATSIKPVAVRNQSGSNVPQHLASAAPVPAPVWLLMLVVLLLPIWVGGGILYIASLVLISSVFALSWNLMFGFGGLATFGHAAFFGIGGYIAAYMLKSDAHASFEGVLLMALLAGGLAAAVIGVIAIRRANGVQLAILTLALAEVLRVLISYSNSLGRDEGLSAIPRPTIGFGNFSLVLTSDVHYYYFLCISCGLMGWAAWALCHSAFGRTLRSIHQDAQRARFLGINVDRFHLVSFIVAAAIAAFVGALAAPLSQIVTPDALSVARSTEPMLHTLVGGAASFWGPVAGTIVFAAIDYATRNLPGLSELIMGVALLAIVLLAPGGLIGHLKSLNDCWRVKRTAVPESPQSISVRSTP